MSNSLRWVAVYTNIRKERLVARLLAHRGYEALFLHYSKTMKHARKTRRDLVPLFPRYLFAGIEDLSSVPSINRVMGVAAVVCCRDQALEIPPPVIEELRARGNADGLVTWTGEGELERRRFNRGEQVNIIEGPLTGFLAYVVLDAGHQVRLWVNQMFQGEVEAVVAPDAIAPVQRSYGAR